MQTQLGFDQPDFGALFADNSSSRLFVLGGTPVPLDRVDLRGVRMTLARNGETVSRGTAALWLASALAGFGDPLRAGDIVPTGALGPMAVAAEGDVFTAHIEGLGTVGPRSRPTPRKVPEHDHPPHGRSETFRGFWSQFRFRSPKFRLIRSGRAEWMAFELA
ncbi:fumarylacetoacetate hydrolase family protein [Streptomyces cellulosae]|uniref:Fumarylacetoacetate hydrolase family protein n=1 Tax=Streptomyces cellulosae TaxID=1968 RepID=A0ABW7XZF8_STRCE